MNNTSNGYTLQGVYIANGFLGVIIDLSQVYLAIYDTHIIPFSYTGSENVDMTDNRISLNIPIKINGELVLHTRNDDGSVLRCVQVVQVLLFDKTHSMGEHQ